MTTENVPHWFNAAAIQFKLDSTQAPDMEQLRAVLDKSLDLQPLSMQETAMLLRAETPEQLEAIFAAARKVKEKVYGDRVVLTAPLHISNLCDSECQYCAARHSNTVIERKRLNIEEVRQGTTRLVRQGHKRMILVAGESWPKDGLRFVLDAVEAIGKVRVGGGEMRIVNVNLPPLHAEEYAELKAAYAGTVLLYQDTYHEESYKKAHPSGPKSNFVRRLIAPDTALSAGLNHVGRGLLLGLGPWRFDLLALVQHVAHQQHVYNFGTRTVSLHRLRPVPGALWHQAPYPVSNEEYLRAVAILRLALPYTGIILTTKEPAHMWRKACDVGCSQLLTGSVANPYESWPLDLKDQVPFPIGEDTHMDEVVRFLSEELDHLPSFCAACPRLGRSGVEFFDLLDSEDMHSLCAPNSIASFEEYLIGYATPHTREQGEKLIAHKLAGMNEHERKTAQRLLEKVRAGRLDEFI